MKIRTAVLALAAVVGLSSAAAAQQAPGFWKTPVIKGYGTEHVWPQATVRPDPAKTYKTVFLVTKAGKADAVNGGLDHVARAVNVFAAAGVPVDHLKFTVIIAGPATPIALSAKSFQAKFNKPNPNLELIEELKKAGVELLVCGNAMGEFGYTPAEINGNLKVALSALSTVIIRQQQGYALLPM